MFYVNVYIYILFGRVPVFRLCNYWLFVVVWVFVYLVSFCCIM